MRPESAHKLEAAVNAVAPLIPSLLRLRAGFIDVMLQTTVRVQAEADPIIK
jgi:hypothetical protein